MTDTEEWTLRRLVSDVIGSGPKSAEDMTREQARAAFDRLLDGDYEETTVGAFWLANRWKRNTPEELSAYTDVMRERSVETAEPVVDPVDCGANYDGKHTSALLGVAAGVVAAAAGTPVVAHSGDRVPTQEATAYKHVLDELGVRTDLEPGNSADMVDEIGFGFYYQPNCNPLVDDLSDRRAEMGVRTFVNTVETLANPSNADVHLGSFYHLSFAVKVIKTLAAAETQDVSRVLMFQGMEGYDDVRPGSTVVAEWTADTGGDPGENVEDFEIATADYGMAVERDDLAVDDVAADSAAITEQVVAGEREDGFADAVVLNAALRVYAREDAASIDDGLSMARDAVADGSAKAVLDDLRAF
ncbi:MAG: anthranilate phosphoribosyltransferase [Haloarculaceae archaeon]